MLERARPRVGLHAGVDKPRKVTVLTLVAELLRHRGKEMG
jgi:hypothetical protein